MRFTKQEEKEGTEVGTGRGLGSGLDVGCQEQQRPLGWEQVACPGSGRRKLPESGWRGQIQTAAPGAGGHYPARYSQDKLRG